MTIEFPEVVFEDVDFQKIADANVKDAREFADIVERQSIDLFGWIPLKDKQWPKKNNLIVVKSEAGVYRSVLIVRERGNGTIAFWSYYPNEHDSYTKDKYANKLLQSRKITHWKLIADHYMDYIPNERTPLGKIPEELMQKPPLELMPKKLHNEQRYSAVERAISNYYFSGLTVPAEWINEFNDLLAEAGHAE